ncbi:MAG TPA: carboxypeptidase-like regulatory domain-containing protein [Longimicrobium sp.]|nr:carboxypeptidase-like regulatory domain-containing protein [Longimicrobium sp.]
MVRAAVAAVVVYCAWGADRAAAQVIVGRVIDAASGGGVARARVTAAGVGHNDTRRTFTDAGGRYSITVRGGSYRVHVRRTGYGETRTDAVEVGPGDTVRMDVRMTATAVGLRALTATTRPRRLPMLGVFTPVYPTDSLLAAERTRGEGGPGRVVVRGVMATPTACWRLAGAADRIGQLITLAIQARPTDDPCPPDAVGASTYKVTLRRLPPGTYTLRVLHVYREEVWRPGVALDSAGVTVR